MLAFCLEASRAELAVGELRVGAKDLVIPQVVKRVSDKLRTAQG